MNWEEVAYNATIQEHGNGLADVGEHVVGDDGELYEVMRASNCIHTQGSGRPNYIYAVVRLASWTDIDEDEEPRCSAVVTGFEEN